MSKTRKIAATIAIVVGVAAIAAMRVPINPGWMGDFMSWQIKRGQARIFCETDQEALLKACRELSKRAGVGKHESRVYRTGILSGRSLPESIRVLRPREVMVCNDGTVHISMYSGWHPFGVWACPVGYEGQRPDDAGRKLLDGLWYYDEDYKHRPDYVDKWIDAQIEEHKAKK